jgi:hypothetical protein
MITPKASQLFSAFALVQQHDLLFGTAGLDYLSALSSEGASMVQAVNGSSLPSALKLSSYPAVPHNKSQGMMKRMRHFEMSSMASDEWNQGLLDTTGTSKWQ